MCVPAGVPLSVFRGRVVADGDPLWTDDDRRWAKAYVYDRQVRMPCGHYEDEASGPDNSDAFVAVPRVCHRCRAVGEAADVRHKTATAADSQHGVLWQVRRG